MWGGCGKAQTFTSRWNRSRNVGSARWGVLREVKRTRHRLLWLGVRRSHRRSRYSEAIGPICYCNTAREVSEARFSQDARLRSLAFPLRAPRARPSRADLGRQPAQTVLDRRPDLISPPARFPVGEGHERRLRPAASLPQVVCPPLEIIRQLQARPRGGGLQGGPAHP